MKYVWMALALLTNVVSAQDISGEWEGKVTVGPQKLTIIVEFTGTEEAREGTIDIIEQSAKDLTLDPIEQNGDQLTIGFPDAPGDASFSAIIRNDSIVGDLNQMGQQFPFYLVRSNQSEERNDRVKQMIADLNWAADSLLTMLNCPGAAVAIVSSDSVYLTFGYGYRDLEKKQPVLPTTTFAIGSCSKAFTAFGLALQEEEGLLDLNDKVYDLLPGFRLYDEYATLNIRVIDLLTHMSGLPRHDLMWYGSSMERQEIFDRLRYLEPTYELREEWQYQNLMFMTAGMLSGTLDGGTWEDVMENRIMKPLNMLSSSPRFEKLEESDAALPYQYKEGETVLMDKRNIDAVGPAGSINSNIVDMAKWVQALLGEGTVNGQEIFPASVVQRSLEPKVIVQRSNSPNESPLMYALGWLVWYEDGHRVIQHGGNIDGYSTLIQMLPDEDIGFIVLTNQNGSAGTGAIANFLQQTWLNGEANDISKYAQYGKLEQETKGKKQRVEGTQPDHPLENYTGVFEHPGYGKAYVWMEDDELSVSFNEDTLPLNHWHYETFSAGYDEIGEQVLITYRSDENGYVQNFEFAAEPSLDHPVVFKMLPDPDWKEEAYLEEFVGDYALETVTLEVRLEGGSLIAGGGTTGRYTMVPYRKDLFKLKEANGFLIEFVRDKKGRVVKMINHQPNGSFPATRVDQK